jgi:hypothetical protein
MSSQVRQCRYDRVQRVLIGAAIAGLALLTAGRAAAQQATFESPTAAEEALKAAVHDKDRQALQRLFGPAAEDLKSGDAVQDQADLRNFARRLERASSLEADGPDEFILLVGVEKHPFAVPIVKKDGKWFFDTAAGKEEMLNRRIGANELQALRVCRGYVVAQREFYLADPDGDGVLEYAQKLASTPGQRDGLYWETKEGEPPSPLGPLVAEARAEGYGGQASNPNGGPRPYHGYVYRLLTCQGEHAAGGKLDYLINGRMVAGFGLVAYPIQWGSSGVMTFLVNTNGKIYEKNLGERTAETAARIDCYDPDQTWSLAGE